MTTATILAHRSTAELLTLIHQQEQRIQSLIWNDALGMLNQAGLHDAIGQLSPAEYTIVFCDINRLKMINQITGNHTLTNRYLRDGLRVRHGEIAGQLYGDEFLFVLPAHADASGFCARIARQLAEQPLTANERTALELIDGDGACLSAAFAWECSTDVWAAVGRLSTNVLGQKARRDTSCNHTTK